MRNGGWVNHGLGKFTHCAGGASADNVYRLANGHKPVPLTEQGETSLWIVALVLATVDKLYLLAPQNFWFLEIRSL